MLVRIIFILCAFAGFGALVYIVLWIAVPSTASTIIGSAKKRLLRDPDDKLIAGVCKGLSYYFGVNVWIPRAIFLIPFFTVVFRWNNWGVFHYPNFFSISFSPAAVLTYIILWIVLPEAKSSTDRLEMKGEKIDLNSIKNNIANEMKGVGERVTRFSKEATAFATETGKQFTTRGKDFGTEVSQTAQRSTRGIGDVLALLVKIFVYFIVGVVLFAVITSLFALGVVMIGFLPLKNYLLDSGWQTVFAWGTLLFIWIPVISIVTSLIRRLAKMKGNSTPLRVSFLSLWLLGLACVVALVVSLAGDFRYRSNANEENIVLENAKVDKLELQATRMGTYYRRYNWLRMEPFANIDEDTAYVNNLHLRIVKASSDSFEVKVLKLSDGASRQQANELSNFIRYNVAQKDSTLLLSKGIAITEDHKFRNQQIYVTVAVPVGKRILVDGSVANWDGNIQIGWNNNDWRYNNNWGDNDNELDWDHDVEYVMTKTGLLRTDGKTGNNDDIGDLQQKLEENKRNREDLEKQRKDMLDKMNLIDSELKQPADTIIAPATDQKQSVIKTAVVPAATSISHILLWKLAI